MRYLHSSLAQGRWHTLGLMEQLGNIGSEVQRALRAQERGDAAAAASAAARALELFDLTISDAKLRGRLREVTRLREVVCDYLLGENQYGSTAAGLQRDFFYYGLAARRGT